LVIVGHALEGFRSSTSLGATKLPKLFHIVRLAEAGFLNFNHQNLISTPDDEISKCSFNISRPLSYLIALRSLDLIWSKDVTCSVHDMLDSYYKCLVSLPAATLAVVLGDMATSSNADYAKLLTEAQAALVDESLHEVVEVAGNALCLAVAPALEVSGAPVPAADWSRAWVSMRSSHNRYKVHFDNATGGTDTRRAFTHSRHTGAIKYKPCTFSYREVCWHVAMARGWRVFPVSAGTLGCLATV